MVYETGYIPKLTVPQWWVLRQLYGESRSAVTHEDLKAAFGMARRAATIELKRLADMVLIDEVRTTCVLYCPVLDPESRRLAIAVLETLDRLMLNGIEPCRPLTDDARETRDVDIAYRPKFMQEVWALYQLYVCPVPHLTSYDMSRSWHLPMRTCVRYLRRLSDSGMATVIPANPHVAFAENRAARRPALETLETIYRKFEYAQYIDPAPRAWSYG